MIPKRLRWLRSAGTGLRNFLHDRSLDRAATIAFYTLVSIGPSLYLLSLILTKILGESEAKGATFTGAAAFVPAVLAPTVIRLEESVALGRGLALVAIPGLLWTTSSAFASLEYAVNVAFRTTASRRFWGSRLKAFGGSLLAALLLGASAAIAQLAKFLARFSAEIGAGSFIGNGPWVATSTRLGVTFAAFAFLYKVLPRGRVAVGAACQAAGISTLLWEVARRLFGILLERTPGYGILTGSLAGFVAFLLWVYTASAVVLLGAEIGAVLNGNRPEGLSSPAASPRPRLP